MTTFILIPGAGGVAWYWHRIAPSLKWRITQRSPSICGGDDPKAGLEAYADLVVAQSLTFRSTLSSAPMISSSQWNFSAESHASGWGVEVDVLRGGHLIALSNSHGLSERLIAYLSK